MTVSQAGPGRKTGHVGTPLPGIEIKIQTPDDAGVGEVWARGPNVMQGYFGNDAATQATVDEDGWLHTGDMGRLDHKGRLFLVGRAKEVVVTAAGENIYLDDVENLLGVIGGVEEYVSWAWMIPGVGSDSTCSFRVGCRPRCGTVIHPGGYRQLAATQRPLWCIWSTHRFPDGDPKVQRRPHARPLKDRRGGRSEAG